MTLPLDRPVLQLLYSLLNTPGLGGLLVLAIIASCGVAFAAALRWIVRGGQVDEAAVYTHPTSALHREERTN